MKNTKILKTTLIILIIILISIISFVGVYVQNKNQMKNILPEYLLSRELSEHTVVELKVSEKEENDEESANEEENTSTNAEEENSDASVKEEASEGETENTTENTTAETSNEESNKSDEKDDTENYKKAKEVITKRLASMNVVDYAIKQNKENGTIIIELPKNDNLSNMINEIASTGKFEIVDSETKEVLMTNDDIKSATAGLGTNSSGYRVAFVNINFNSAGTKKFKDITNTYIKTTVEKEKTEEVAEEATNEIAGETSTEATNEIASETSTEATNETSQEQEKTEGQAQTETVTKKVTMKLDDSELFSTYFEGEISNGVLQLTVGSSSNSTNVEELQEFYNNARNLASLLNSGKLPIAYELEKNETVSPNVTFNQIKTVIIVAVVVFAVALCYMIVKYKGKGIMLSISQIGYVALLLIAIRYFNVEVSIGGIIAILLCIAISYVISIKMLKEKRVLKTIGESAIVLIPTLIISICLTFANISSGMVLFWGIVITLLYHISISNLLLKD